MADGKKIPLVELFGPTIQGEGAVIGQQTYFLRFGLCDYKCTMCDSMHAVDPMQVRANATYATEHEIFEHLTQYHLAQGEHTTKNVTFSGGNPCIHDLSNLVEWLKDAGWRIMVETQGTLAPDWARYVDVLTVSPKGPGMGEKTDLHTLDYFMAHYPSQILNMKIVVFDQRDLEFASMMVERYHKYGIPFFLSLGNTEPSGNLSANHFEEQLAQYRNLFEDIKTDPVLSKVRFLPQWHHLVWGNLKGK